jgi:hypothetical protein
MRDKRREAVEELYLGGMTIAEVTRAVKEKTGEEWNRRTIEADVRWVRRTWVRENAKRDRECHVNELERMLRRIFRTAMERKKTALVKELAKGADGKDETVDGKATGRMVTKTIVVPDPDLGAANTAIQRLAELRGLKVTQVEGELGVKGLADLVGEVLGPEDDG